MLRSATAWMLPPRPPSPPSGPPLGMNFSRRKLAAPLPPLPATTSMVASSTNFMVVGLALDGAGRGGFRVWKASGPHVRQFPGPDRLILKHDRKSVVQGKSVSERV